MIIRLGLGYWIDGSDGFNWVLRKGDSNNPRKKGKVIGYYGEPEHALRAAVVKGALPQEDYELSVREIGEAFDRATRTLLEHIEVERTDPIVEATEDAA